MGMSKVAELEVAGQVVRITHPDKVFFPERGDTKLDLANYYLALGDAAVRAVRDRPCVLKRFPDGALSEPFYQKRVPAKRPEWLQTATIHFPSGRSAEELCPADLAHVLWAVNLGCLGLDPWPVRRSDLDHPDELRVDLDPQPGVPFQAVREVADRVREVLEGLGLRGYAKTSGSRGIHVLVRIQPRWTFTEVRHAALALGREVARQLPDLATVAWWKEERGERVLVDYNQNARDRTVVAAYAVRNNAIGRVCCPFAWEELAAIDPDDWTLATVPERVRRQGDPMATLDDRAFSLQPLLDLATEQAQPDAPWPPQFPKMAGEPKRVQPSRARRAVRK